MFSSPCISNKQHSDKIAFMRLQSQLKLKSSWEQLIEKYAQNFKNSDIIDIQTGKIVVDKGHLRSTEIPQFGGDESDSLTESKDESDTDILDTLINPERKHVSKSSLLRKELNRNEKFNQSPASTVKWDSEDDEPDFKQLAKLRAKRIEIIQRKSLLIKSEYSKSKDDASLMNDVSCTDDENISESSDDCSSMIGNTMTPTKQANDFKSMNHTLTPIVKRKCIENDLNQLPLKSQTNTKQSLMPGERKRRRNRTLKNETSLLSQSTKGHLLVNTPQVRITAPIKRKQLSHGSYLSNKTNDTKLDHNSSFDHQNQYKHIFHQDKSQTPNRNILIKQSNFPSPLKLIQYKHESRQNKQHFQYQRSQYEASKSINHFDEQTTHYNNDSRTQHQSDGFQFKRKRDSYLNHYHYDTKDKQEYYYDHQQQLSRFNVDDRPQLFHRNHTYHNADDEFHEIVYVNTDRETDAILNGMYGKEKGFKEYNHVPNEVYQNLRIGYSHEQSSPIRKWQMSHTTTKSKRYEDEFSRACLADDRQVLPYVEEVYYTPVKKVQMNQRIVAASTGKINRTRVSDRRELENNLVKRTLFECRK